jgi:hypothetical protein
MSAVYRIVSFTTVFNVMTLNILEISNELGQ